MPAPSDVCLGVGIDVVDLPHFVRFLRRNQSSLWEIFTEREMATAERERRDLYLATRWALKEATLKALGTGWGSGVQLIEVEALGRLSTPRISLHGRAQQLAEEAGGASVTGSTGCAGECVIAMVVLDAASVGAESGRNGEVLSP
jgi:holo-[acyl-carrier protein] synthase